LQLLQLLLLSIKASVFQWAAAVVQSAVALSEMSSYAELSIAAKIQAATAAVSFFAGVNKVVCCCQ
jgi:hypothetical protein